MLGIASGLKTHSKLSLSYSAQKSFNTNHNISTTHLVQTYTHTKSHIFLKKNHHLSISQLKYFSTQNLLQHSSYFIEHTNLFQVVKSFSGFTFRNSEYTDLSSKYFFLTSTKSAHSIKICLTVITVLHATQTAISSVFKK